MSDQTGDDQIVLAVITITKTLTDEGIIVGIESATPAGDVIALVDALGMLSLGKHILIRQTDEDEANAEVDD